MKFADIFKIKMKEFIVASDSVSKDGLKIKVMNMDIAAFEANPVMYYNHDRSRYPIGAWKEMRRENGKMYATAEFDTDDEVGVVVARKVEKGFLRSASVGIQILEYRFESNSDANGEILVVEGAKLIEVSVVDIPANDDCTAVFVLADNGEMKPFAGEVIQNFKHQFLNKTEFMNENLKKVEDAFNLKLSALEQKLDTVLTKLTETAAQNPPVTQSVNTEKTLTIADLIKEVKAQSANGTEDRTNWTFQDYRKKDTQALIKMKTENPELYQRLAKEDRVTIPTVKS